MSPCLEEVDSGSLEDGLPSVQHVNASMRFLKKRMKS